MGDILRIVHTVSSLDMGGMEHFVLRLVLSQRQVGMESSVMTFKRGVLLQTAHNMAVPVNLIDSKSKTLRILKCLITFKRIKPDIVHAHNPTSLQYAILSKLTSNSHIIITDHAQTKGIIRNQSLIERYLTDIVVAVSKHTADKSTLQGKKPGISIIHNGIDIKKYNIERIDIRNKLKLGDNFTAIMVASFTQVKGYDILLKSINILINNGFSFIMMLVGDGPEYNSIELLSKNLNINKDYIRFLGNRNDVFDLLNASDMFILPSRLEGLPISILEAMSQRLPVIATNVGGIPELVIDGETGILIPPNDPLALAEAMKRMISDPDMRRRMGEAGYQRVASEFSFERMTRQYEELYLSLLRERGS